MILLFIIMRMKVLKEMGCDDLKVSLDTTVQWGFFCFIMFNAVKRKVCRNSLTKILMLVSEMHHFNTKRVHGTNDDSVLDIINWYGSFTFYPNIQVMIFWHKYKFSKKPNGHKNHSLHLLIHLL